jgi:hypothetical protein
MKIRSPQQIELSPQELWCRFLDNMFSPGTLFSRIVYVDCDDRLAQNLLAVWLQGYQAATKPLPTEFYSYLESKLRQLVSTAKDQRSLLFDENDLLSQDSILP